MITPEYLNEIMYGVEDKLSKVNEYLLQRIVKRIMATFENGDGELFIPSTISDMRKLMAQGVLYEDIQQAVQKALPEIEGAIKEAFYQSASEITNQNNKIAIDIVKANNLEVSLPRFEKAEITKYASDLNMTKTEIRRLESAYNRTKGEMRNLTRTTALKAQMSYVNACDRAYMKVQSGVSVQTSIVDAIKEVSDRGIEVVDYRNRKSERIEVAIARAVRTGVNQANSDIVLTRCAEMGVNFVKVSSHLGARVTGTNDYTNHSWWQGGVYSLNWDNSALVDYAKAISETEKGFEWLAEMRNNLQEKQRKYNYPDFIESTGYGDILGLCGVNCRHSFYPYHPDLQDYTDDRPNLEENEKIYRLEQRARAMERAIRKTKRELAGFKASGRNDDEFRQEKKRIRDLLYKQSEVYMKFCKDNKITPRNMSLKV